MIFILFSGWIQLFPLLYSDSLIKEEHVFISYIELVFENTLALDAERDSNRSDVVCFKGKYCITAAAW